MDILCIGTLVADILVHPVDSVDFNLDLQPVEQIQLKNGGDGMNVAINASKLSNEVGMIGCIGDDNFGRMLQRQLKLNHVDIRGLMVDRTASTSSVIVLIRNDGKRCFLFHGGANHVFEFNNINIDLLKDASIIHIGGFYQMPRFDGDGTAKLMRLAKEMHKTTTLDVNWDHSGKWRKTIEDTLKYVDYFIPSEEEAALISGQKIPEKIADTLLDMGTKNVLIKMGEKGAYFKNNESSFLISTHKVKVIDTTGAGDSFVGGFLTGLAKGWNMHDCARLATASAAFCVQEIGATSGIKSYEEILLYMQNDPVDIVENPF